GNRKEKRMERHYETIWIVKTELGAPGIKEIQEKASAVITGGKGTVNKVDEWGVRRFAYPIQKKNEGYYTLMDFNSEPAAVAEMEKIFKFNEDVVRYQTVRLDEEYVEPVAVAEPVAEPAAEPAVEAEPEPAAEPVVEAEAEPAAEPAAEAESVEALEEEEKVEKAEEGATDGDK
ncbi:MAG: 30S ribosomal protein S6, partial [Thermodesulfobacteriota bacterium]